VTDLLERHNLLEEAQDAVKAAIEWYEEATRDDPFTDAAPIPEDEARISVIERLREGLKPYRGIMANGQKEVLVGQISKAFKLTKTSVRDLFVTPKEAKSSAKTKGSAFREEDCTDAGNGQRLIRIHGQDLSFCDDWGAWLFWTGTRWRKDNVNHAVRLAQTVRKDLYREVSMLASKLESASSERKHEAIEARIEETVRWAKRSGNGPQVKYMLKLAQSHPDVAVVPEDLDRDRYLLNVANGTIDLHTGTLREHRRGDHITNIVPILYDPEAKCPRWEQFLREILLVKDKVTGEITGTDEALIEFIRQAFAYSLTGSVAEQCMFICYGTGANGKSTMLDVLMALAGDYARAAPPNLLLSSKSDQHPAEIALLRGSRVVTSFEAEQGRRLAEAKVKWLTGGDKRPCRGMGENWWHYDPTDKIWMAVNHKPVIRGTDTGIWRRIRLIPFYAKFEEGDEARDMHLPETLHKELSGILTWALNGLDSFHQKGLKSPHAVIEQTKQYKSEMDIVGDFIGECCIVSAGVEVPMGELYKRYVEWCNDSGERCLTKRRFADQLTESGYPADRSGTARTRCRIGLRLIPNG
jgi:putative DNA primase/helicase